jgi:hypothetical protein
VCCQQSLLPSWLCCSGPMGIIRDFYARLLVMSRNAGTCSYVLDEF